MRFKRYFLVFLVFTTGITAQHQEEPYREIRVALDGSEDYASIQEAVNSARDLGPGQVSIYIKSGTYNEKIVIPSWKHKLKLIGEDKEKTIITYNDHSGKTDSLTAEKLSTFTSYTLLVQGDDIQLENLTIENSSCGEGQAVALHVEGDRFQIADSQILGCQDTVYTANGNSRQYYKNCYIEGTTDFIFGQATAVFEGCTIKSLKNSYITAAATTQDQDFGYVFIYCRLIAADGVERVYLGRPWRPYAKTVFIESEFGGHILPEGWNPWHGDEMFPDKQKTACYAEYENSGPGSATSERIEWARQLSKEERAEYTLENIFSRNQSWSPSFSEIER